MAQSVRSTRRNTGAKKTRRALSSGQVHIFASFNNTIVTVTDTEGNTVAWGSAGRLVSKAPAKALHLPHALRLNRLSKLLSNWVFRKLICSLKGPGPGRENAIRAVQAMGLKVRSISDITPVPHNGCRPPKKRRV